MTTIYLLFAGDYSDRRVIGAYSTRQLAEAGARIIASIDIEEHEIDPALPTEVDGLLWFRCVWSNDGAIETRWMGSAPTNPEPRSCQVEQRSRWLTTYVVARDAEHAIKIAADRFREFRANQPANKEAR